MVPRHHNVNAWCTYILILIITLNPVVKCHAMTILILGIEPKQHQPITNDLLNEQS
jgi:hypothetical protein